MPLVTDPQEMFMSSQVLDALLAVRDRVFREAPAIIEDAGGDSADPDLANLAQYLALRHHDLRKLQRRLTARGLSSLGRLESRVLPSLDATVVALAALAGRSAPFPAPSEEDFFEGEERLVRASDALFGSPPAGRRTRIMVTLPAEAATDRDLVLEYAARGMDIARINCAHDDATAWAAMARNVRDCEARIGRPVSVLMDIAGPKIRTEKVVLPEKGARLQVGDRFRLVSHGEPPADDSLPFAASLSLPGLVARLSPGDTVRYDDGRLEGIVRQTDGQTAVIEVSKAKRDGVKLKPEKGLNFPDTELGLSALTDKDQRDLSVVADCADMIGYSFVSRPEDIDLLEKALGAVTINRARPLGIVAKIERPEAVANIPALIARTRGRGPFGIMIARGDLAAELGFERMAEMQEEILWICEAARVPVIWATQVLESLVKDGVPSRGEMTDAAMASRAECVMLNKGPFLAEGVALLDRLLARMDQHLFKKSPTLRALKSW